jgi:hypothetical protein
MSAKLSGRLRRESATLPRWTWWIWSASTVYLAVGLMALIPSLITGHFGGLELFFRYPGTLLLILLSASATWFSLQVEGEFSPGEPLRLGWLLITLSAACSLFATFCVHVVSMPLVNRLFDQRVIQEYGRGALIQQVGVLAGGTLRFALLSGALFCILRIYHESGLLARLEVVDWVVLAGMAVFICLEVRETVLAIRGRIHPPLGMELGWPTDPLLLVLLFEALLLFRSARQMRPGLIGKCWQAIAIGALLVALGDVLLWAARESYLPWPWSSVEWYVWMPAEAAFAVAPLYQLRVMHAARSSRRRSG